MIGPRTGAYLIGWALGVLMGIGLAGLLDESTKKPREMRAFQKEAVEHGAAHWSVDAKGDVMFHWNDEKPAAEKP